MGFSYERGVGEMLENMGHRAESILEKTFERLTKGEDNLWRRFIRYQQAAPGRAAVGNIHFAPNSQKDYDWNNPTPVLSECDDWLHNFPYFKGVTRTVTAAEWGSGDIREHHKWWFRHIPRVAGSKNGIRNNWWQYIMNPNHVKT
jgi:thioesterase domain-containing protein